MGGLLQHFGCAGWLEARSGGLAPVVVELAAVVVELAAVVVELAVALAQRP